MSYTFGSDLIPEVFWGARGDIRSLPTGGVNLCLHVTHKQKNPVLFFEKAVYRFATRCIAQLGTASLWTNAPRDVMTKDSWTIARTQSYSVLRMISAGLCREFADQLLKSGFTTERQQALHCSPTSPSLGMDPRGSAESLGRRA